MDDLSPSLPPGFRFHPTDEELILHYLSKKAASAASPVAVIADVDIYKFNPWDLPAKALFGDREWYFFSPRDRKHPNGARPNRMAASGYWKATGADKPIVTSRASKIVGFKRALAFCSGKPPKGVKTNWLMHEYRLAEVRHRSQAKPVVEGSMRLDEWVLCRIYQRASHHLPADGEKGAWAEEDLGTQTLTSPRTTNRSFSVSELLMEEGEFSPEVETPVGGWLTSQDRCLAREINCRNGDWCLEEGQSSHPPELLHNAQMRFFHLSNQLDVSQSFLNQQQLLDSLLEMP